MSDKAGNLLSELLTRNPLIAILVVGLLSPTMTALSAGHFVTKEYVTREYVDGKIFNLACRMDLTQRSKVQTELFSIRADLEKSSGEALRKREQQLETELVDIQNVIKRNNCRR